MKLLGAVKTEAAGATLQPKYSPQDNGRFQARNASSTADTTRSI
jgi:hypothetical protein